MQRVRSSAIDTNPVTGAPPLTVESLVEHLRSGCKPPSNWKCGTEHEKIGFDLETKRRLTYDQIHAILESLIVRFGWQPMMENGVLIGCSLDGQSVTLEPGGQLELSGAPLESIHKTCAEVNSHLYQV